MLPCNVLPGGGRFPRRTGSAWEILAPAKLNLYLEVLGPRDDGFHALETLMVPVRVFDQLQWREDRSGVDDPTLRVRSLLPGRAISSEALESDDNLVVRAARLLGSAAGVEPRGRFELVKRIPVQAGMGGGSSDAAAALLLANEAWQVGWSVEQLMPLAAQLGSDVPFFLAQSAAVCRGRGELVEPVCGLSKLHFVVVKPDEGLSTPKVFGNLPLVNETADELAASSSRRVKTLIAALRSGDLSSAGSLMLNRLESAAERLAPWLVRVRDAVAAAGCAGHFMTGSGSAYVGVMRSARQAQGVARLLSSRQMGNVFATSTC